MSAVKSPKFWLQAWGGLGALMVLYVIIAASVKGAGDARLPPGARDPSLLVGEMADFEYPLVRRAAPEIPFEHEGEAITLADFRGRVVLANFWATWCAPCLKELPSLDALEGELGGEDFQVVAVAADPRGPAKAAEFLETLQIRHLKLYADQRLRLAGAVGGPAVLPISILYDRKGKEIGRLVGDADWQSPEARRLITAAIAAP